MKFQHYSHSSRASAQPVGASKCLQLVAICLALISSSITLSAAFAASAKSPGAFVTALNDDGLTVELLWRDRSDSERGFQIERKKVVQGRKGPTRIKRIRKNRTSFADRPGKGVFLYRIGLIRRSGPVLFTKWSRIRVSGSTNLGPTPSSSPSPTGTGSPASTPSATASPTATPTATATATPYVEGVHECNDGIDNDSDSAVDAADDGCFGPNQRETASSADGWTRFLPSSDTRIVYVSSSTGQDCSGCGLSPSQPARTIAKGYSLLRNGFPDWLLLKRGDVWNSEVLGAIPTGSAWERSGRSVSEKVVIGGYGSGARPIVRTPEDSSAFYEINPLSHVAVVGLHLEPANRAWHDASTGIGMLGAATDILFEDLFVRGYGTNFVIQKYAGTPTDISIRRSVIVDAWSATSHSQGIYTSEVENLLIEENVFDHNGWQDAVAQVNLTTATWDASERLLTQAGAFGTSSRPHLWENGGTIEIAGGLFTTGSISNPGATATGRIFRGDMALSSVDDYYTGKFLKFTSGANPLDGRTNRFQRITNYVGATREFTVTATGDAFHAPADGDTFRIDVMGVFTIEERINTDSIRLVTNDLSPVDLTTGDISSGGGAGATIFNRSMYLSGGQGNTITRRNIDANGASGGIQQRKGGASIENLFLRSPLALGFGHAQNASGTVHGTIEGNVILNARDIETQPRGFGISVSGNGPYSGGSTVYADGVEVSENIVAHNTLGTANLIAFEVGNWNSNLNFHHNIAYDWKSPSGEGTGFRKNSGALVSNMQIHNNDFQQTTGGQVIQVLDSTYLPGIMTFTSNRYWSSRASSSWFYFNNGNRPASLWATTAGDASTLTQVNYSDPNRTIETYMGSLAETASYEAFMVKARALSKTNWDPKYTAIRVINYIRAGFDKAARPE